MGYWIAFGTIALLCVAALWYLAKAEGAMQSGRRRTVIYLQMSLAVVILLLDLLSCVFFLVQSRSGQMKEADRKARQEYEKEQRLLEEQNECEEETLGAGILTEEQSTHLENDVTTPEGAYKYLYDEMFEKAGYQYMTTYNAKGNFYGILYTGEDTIGDIPDQQIRITAVYNGESKNERCQVFVQYKELLDETDNATQTGIMDFYAIDMQTKEVIRGDKHAWEELGSKDYLEATEK